MLMRRQWIVAMLNSWIWLVRRCWLVSYFSSFCSVQPHASYKCTSFNTCFFYVETKNTVSYIANAIDNINLIIMIITNFIWKQWISWRLPCSILRLQWVLSVRFKWPEVNQSLSHFFCPLYFANLKTLCNAKTRFVDATQL